MRYGSVSISQRVKIFDHFSIFNHFHLWITTFTSIIDIPME
uniref:Bm13361, isoform a n=1 Tax=Brugia malayi TaxID=6279 RepID=A0A0J9Y6H3_BRUMA|nr:Bm13361, isoform a [Brugia malayi]